MVAFEIELIKLSLTYPHILIVNEPKLRNTPLFWSNDYTQTDLLELICALHESKAICYADGTSADLNTIIKVVEEMFNVKIKNIRALKFNLINRKVKLSSFIDTLRTAMINLCS